jgi:hypothetical protein
MFESLNKISEKIGFIDVNGTYEYTIDIDKNSP